MKRLSIVLGAVIGILLFGAFFSAAPDDSVQGIQTLTTDEESYVLTLITGDKLTVQEMDDGKMSVDMEPSREDDRQSGFHKIEKNGDVYIIPEDVYPFVPEKIDRELFNVTQLIEHGYDDEHMDKLPVIVSLKKNKGSLNAVSDHISAVVSEQHTFSSIDAMAAKVDKKEMQSFSDLLFTTKDKALESNNVLQNNIDKIRLDRKVHINLEESVPAIGAPKAWDAGYDGTGVKVAVLDTGIDDNHSDLDGKVVKEKNFSSDDTTKDLQGHGTHVASTVSGSGAASDGKQKGVAPGAELLNGKVMNKGGTGTESDIIEGMEWAAKEGADVISMSLGSDPTDGTDPLSEAVNNITEEEDVLFTISSGNSGPGEGSVEAPGTADAALTVGNVNNSNELSITSSRGPRVDDYAIKPELTAPGTDITAARAEGTSMGNPVNDDYTKASGTSMATPHVAGAAALLIHKWKSEDKDWSPKKLKAALISTATPNDENTVYEQGGGMADVEQAMTQEVFAHPTTLNMGNFKYPHEDNDPVTKKVTYSNTSNEDVTLYLAADIHDSDGESTPDDMVIISEEEVLVSAGNKEEIDVTIDPVLGDIGAYGGYIKAKSENGETQLRTPIGFYKEPEMHTLTVKGITRHGEPVEGLKTPGISYDSLDVVNVEDTTIFEETTLSSWDEDGVMELRVPPGKYSVMGGWSGKQDEVTLVGNPEVNIEEDTTIVLDGREANKADVELEDEVDVILPGMSYYRKAEKRGSYSHGYSLKDRELYAATTEPVSTGDFEFYTDWELVEPGDIASSSYYYRLVYPEPDVIPSDLHYEVNKDDLAQKKTNYYGHDGAGQYKHTQSKWLPYESTSIDYVRKLDANQTRMEYFNPGNSRYKKGIKVETDTGEIKFTEPTTKYDKGKQEDSWLKQAVLPNVLPGNESLVDPNPVYREDNTLSVSLPEYMDTDNHYVSALSGLSSFQLFEDDELIADSDQPKGDFDLSSDKAEYRMELTTNMIEGMSPFSSKTYTNWTFYSEEPSEDEDVLFPEKSIVPLLTVNYDLDLKLTNVASLPDEVDGTLPISFQIDHQPEAEKIPIDDAKLWISYNDGDDWKEIENLNADGKGKFTANIEDLKDNRDGSGYVSLKIKAEDVEGNSIEQEVTRAYKWNFEGDISGDDMIDIYDVMRAVAFYGTDNEKADINGDGIVDEKDMRILEKNFLKVGPKASKNDNPTEKIGGKGLDDLLRSVGLEPLE